MQELIEDTHQQNDADLLTPIENFGQELLGLLIIKRKQTPQLAAFIVQLASKTLIVGETVVKRTG